jgi:hypothetical protein
VVAALAILFRYEYILFITPLALWGLYVMHGSLLRRAYALDVAIVGAILFAFFVLPVAVLNQEVYGSWRVYGPSVFGDAYFPERNPPADATFVESLATSARQILLPSYPFNPLQLLQNLPRFTIWLMPAFTLSAGIGAFYVLKARCFSAWQTALLLLIAGYSLVYLGSGVTFQASGLNPTFGASIVRYWLLFYTLLFFLAVFAIHSTRDMSLKLVLVGGILLTGPISLYSVLDGNLSRERFVTTRLAAFGEEQIVPNFEPDAIIYSGQSDKRILSYRDVATWWPGGNAVLYDPSKVASSMARLSTTGRPLYIYKEAEVDISELNQELKPRGLEATPAKVTGFFRIQPLAESAWPRKQ